LSPQKRLAAISAPLPPADAVDELARALSASGRVVPGLEVAGDGRARSWWWPFPAAGQRGLIASLARDPSVASQRAAARALAARVDELVRERLVREDVHLVPSRRGRPTPAEAWLRALASRDPWLPASVDAAKLAALAGAVQTWVRSGTLAAGRVRLCLRIHEPSDARGWSVELLAQDRNEPSLVVPLADVWAGTAPFVDNAAVAIELLRALGRLARLAPELAGALEQARPSSVDIEADALVRLLRDRTAILDDAGIAVLLPSWWTHRPKLGLRAKVGRTRRSASGGVGGFGLDAIVSFSWEAALGTDRLTKRDLAALAKAAEAKQALVRVRGQWVAIDPTRVGELVDAVGRRGEASAHDLLRTGLGIADLDAPADLDVVEVDASSLSWLADLLDGALHGKVEPLPTPAGFDGELRPYQQRGAGWMSFLGRLGLGACLADDMGLGKTAQLIATLLAEPTTEPALIVCPVSVLGNWERELARFAPSLSVLVHYGRDRFTGSKTQFAERARQHDVVITTYSLVARDGDSLATVNWGRVVLDEAQQVKNPATAQSIAVRRLNAPRRVALTGTPVENRLSELWSIMQLLNPGLLGSARSFKERFALPIERDHDEEAADLLRRVTGPFVLRRLKSDKSIITDLPDKIETVDHCPLTQEQATLYQAVVDDLLTSADDTEGMSRRGLVLAGLSRLKQVCNHPAQFLADGSPLRGRSGKLQRVEELLDEILAEEDKVLCFTQFASWGDLLKPYLEARLGAEVLWLHGGVRRQKRDELVERFQSPDGPAVMLVSLKAGGTGLNLVAASHVIHLDRWWNPAVEDQATDRAYRIGQWQNVHVHKLITTGTIEDRIDEMITAKRALASRIVGTGEDWLTELSTDELRDLVSLRAEAGD
jgi:SNF2 family DNA or RNA helicase